MFKSAVVLLILCMTAVAVRADATTKAAAPAPSAIYVSSLDSDDLRAALNTAPMSVRPELLNALGAATGSERERLLKILGNQSAFNKSFGDGSKMRMEQFLADSIKTSKPNALFILDMVAGARGIETAYMELSDAVAEELVNPDVEIRRAAAHACITVVSTWRDRLSTTPFLEVGQKMADAVPLETDLSVKIALIEGIGELRSPTGAQSLLENLTRDASPEVRKQACQSLQKIVKNGRYKRGVDFAEIVGKAANDPEPMVAEAGKNLWNQAFPGEAVPVYYSKETKLMMLIAAGSTVFLFIGGIVFFFIMRSRRKVQAAPKPE